MMTFVLQTSEVQSDLQAAEEPEQPGGEQGTAGRSSWQRLQRAAAAHGAARRLALTGSTEDEDVAARPTDIRSSFIDS